MNVLPSTVVFGVSALSRSTTGLWGGREEEQPAVKTKTQIHMGERRMAEDCNMNSYRSLTPAVPRCPSVPRSDTCVGLILRTGHPHYTDENSSGFRDFRATPPLTERTGWSIIEPLLENAFRNTSSIPTTPSAPLRWLRIFFLMAQPPLLYQGGELRASHPFVASISAPAIDPSSHYLSFKVTGLQ